MPNVITEIEQGAVKVWDEFLDGVHWLGAEAKIVAAAVEKVDPGIQVQLQAILTAGEDAASVYAGIATGGSINIIGAGADDLEQLIVQVLEGMFGSSATSQKLSAATVATVDQVSKALQAYVPVAAAKITSVIAAQATGAAAAPVVAADKPA